MSVIAPSTPSFKVQGSFHWSRGWHDWVSSWGKSFMSMAGRVDRGEATETVGHGLKQCDSAGNVHFK
jgi:hypothetical protein